MKKINKTHCSYDLTDRINLFSDALYDILLLEHGKPDDMLCKRANQSSKNEAAQHALCRFNQVHQLRTIRITREEYEVIVKALNTYSLLVSTDKIMIKETCLRFIDAAKLYYCVARKDSESGLFGDNESTIQKAARSKLAEYYQSILLIKSIFPDDICMAIDEVICNNHGDVALWNLRLADKLECCLNSNKIPSNELVLVYMCEARRILGTINPVSVHTIKVR